MKTIQGTVCYWQTTTDVKTDDFPKSSSMWRAFLLDPTILTKPDLYIPTKYAPLTYVFRLSQEISSSNGIRISEGILSINSCHCFVSAHSNIYLSQQNHIYPENQFVQLPILY
jgi:hypothetical protein